MQEVAVIWSMVFQNLVKLFTGSNFNRKIEIKKSINV
jgi:hypothetical protein